MEQVGKHEASILLTSSSSARPLSYSPPRSSRKYDKPWILRIPALFFLLAIILALIGLVEYAFHVLPQAGSNGFVRDTVGTVNDYFSYNSNNKRQSIASDGDYFFSTITTTVSGTKETLAVSYGPSACPSGEVCAPPPQYWLPLGTVTVSQDRSNPTPPAPPPTSSATSAPAPSFWLSLGTTTITSISPVGAPAPSFWLSAGDSVTLFSGSTGLSTTTVTLASTTITQVTTYTSPPVIYVFLAGNYFIGAFLPTLLAVLFAFPWLIVDAKVRKLEPFHQLTNKNGAVASRTICADYSSQLTAPFKAVAWGHLAPILTSILSTSALLITPLAPEAVSIRMDGTCDANTRGCLPSLSIYPVAGRLVQALLCIMALAVVILIIHMLRYTTGIFAEASSIAGLATLFHHPDMVDDLRQARGASTASIVHLKRYLAKGRYRLDSYRDQDGLEKYGIIPEHCKEQPIYFPQKIGQVSTREVHYSSLEGSIEFTRPHLAGAIGLICFLLGLLAVIIYYKLTNINSGFERFMDSEGFGVKFLFTAVGVFIKLYWGSIFKAATQLDAYRNLAKRNSTAKESILITQYSLPLTAIPSTFEHCRIFTALIACVAFLADVLTVTLSNIQFKTATTWTAYTVCTWMSCGIIALMIITLVALVFRRQPALPFEPNTIAAVLSLLCWSSIPSRLGDIATMSEKERNNNIEKLGVRYGIGGVRDDNGQVVIGVEIERSASHIGLG